MAQSQPYFHTTSFDVESQGPSVPNVIKLSSRKPQGPAVPHEIALGGIGAANSITFSNVATAIADKVRTAGNTITFGQTVDVSPKPVSAGNTITFSQQTALGLEIQRAAGNTITFGQTAEHNFKLESVGHTITFGQTLTSNIFQEAVNNTVNFSQQTAINFELSRQASNLITFTDWVDSNFVPVVAGNTITFDQDVSTNNIMNRSVEHTINFEHTMTGGRAREVTASNTITFSQDLHREYPAENTITFSQMVTFKVTRDVTNTITFTQTVALELDIQRAAANTITFQQQAVAYVEKACDLHTFSPFGELPAPPAPGTRSGIQLTDGTTTLEFRNPVFGNNDSLEVTNQINRSRGGTYNIFARDIWPNNLTLDFEVRNLTQAEAQAFLSFHKTNLGKDITLIDQENRVWMGVMTSVAAPIQDAGRDCRYVISVTFFANEITPTKYSGLVAWYDGSQLNTMTVDGSNRISQWDDLSGNGLHISQATESKMPIVGTLNGLVAPLFASASSQVLFGTGSPITGAPMTTFAVFNSTVSVAQQLVTWVGSSGNEYFATGIAFLKARSTAYAFSGEGGPVHALSTLDTTLGDAILAVSVEETTQRSIRQDGGNEGTESTTMTPILADISLGGADSAGSLGLTGHIGEVLFFDRLMTTKERTEIERYLAAKWGVTLA
jgi:hypothetical protein